MHMGERGMVLLTVIVRGGRRKAGMSASRDVWWAHAYGKQVGGGSFIKEVSGSSRQ